MCSEVHNTTEWTDAHITLGMRDMCTFPVLTLTQPLQHLSPRTHTNMYTSTVGELTLQTIFDFKLFFVNCQILSRLYVALVKCIRYINKCKKL